MKSLWEQLLAEFIGTFALVFVGALAVIVLSGQANALGPGFGGAAGLLGIALAHGLVLGVMVSNLGHISGAHFNPAVTVGAWVTAKIETLRAALYIVVQLLAGAAAALALRLALPGRLWEPTSIGLPTINQPVFTPGRAVALEAILAFFLVLTVFAVAIDDRGVFKSIAGLPIGLVLTFDILAGGALTGASMNPARSFGPALVSGNWTDWWVYFIGPVAGGVIAASVYWFAYLRDRMVRVSRTETPIGGGPEEDLGVSGEADYPGDNVPETVEEEDVDEAGAYAATEDVDSTGDEVEETVEVEETTVTGERERDGDL